MLSYCFGRTDLGGICLVTNDMTTGSPAKLILYFSIPLLIGNIFQQFYSMVDTMGIMIVQSALNIFGSAAIASYTAASKALQLVIQPAVTFDVTMYAYCAQNLGAKNYNRIKDGVRECTKISVITSIIAGLVLIFFGKYFIMLFINNPDETILSYASQCLNIAAIFFIPLGLIFVYRNALQGIGESFIPMMAGVYELTARALAAFILPSFLDYLGICLADPIAWIAASVPLAFTYFKRIKALTDENIV